MCTRFSGYIFRTVILFKHIVLYSGGRNLVLKILFEVHLFSSTQHPFVVLFVQNTLSHPVILRLCPFLMAKGISWRQQINRSCFKIQYTVLFLLIREPRLQVFRIVIERCKLVHVFINFVVVRGFLLLISLTLVPAQFALSCSLMDVFIFLISPKKFSQKFSIEMAWS